MKREAFKMFLKPGFEDEYQRRHAAIWPELKKMLSGGNLLGLLHQHPVCMPENQRRGIVAGHGFQPNCTKMVGLYGRHHGDESRQFARNNSAEGDFPYGLSPLGPS